MKSKLTILGLAAILTSCGGVDCDFSSQESAQECACQLFEMKKAAKGDFNDLKATVKDLDKAYEEAVETGVVDEAKLKAYLEENCDAYEAL